MNFRQRFGPSGPIAPHNLLAFDTLADVNAFTRPITVGYVWVSGLTSVGDQDGGMFQVSSGLTADAWNVIDLTGENTGLQLVRRSMRLGSLDFIKSGSTTVTIAATNTPVFVGGTWAISGTSSPPWSSPNPSEFQWDAEQTLRSQTTFRLSGTGTAGDVLELGLSAAGAPAFAGPTGLCTVLPGGRWQVDFTVRFQYPKATAVAIVGANATAIRNFTVTEGSVMIVPEQGSV